MKISVIVNAYQNSRYLNQCLKSLEKQTFTDFEVIIVNDGNSLKINNVINNFINRFSKNVIVINTNNKGISFSRNKAIKVSTGEYIKFLDEDDTIKSNALQIMYDEAKKTRCDCLIFRGYTKLCFLKFKNDFNIDNRKPNVYEFPMIGNKLFKRSALLENLFLEGYKWEDLSNIPVILSNYNISIINDRLFNYRIHKNTTINDFFYTDDSILDIIKVLEHIKPKINRKDFNSIAIIHTLFRLENMFYSRNKDEKLIGKLKDYLYLIDNYWFDYEIIKIYRDKNILFKFFLKHSHL